MPMSQAQAGRATAYEPGSGLIYQAIPSGAALALAVLDTYTYVERYRVPLQGTAGWSSLDHQVLCIRGTGHILLRVAGGINQIHDVNNGLIIAAYSEDTALDEYDWKLGLRYGQSHMLIGYDVKAGSTGMVYGLFDPAAATFVTGHIPGITAGGNPTYGISGSGFVSFYITTSSTTVTEAIFDGDWTVNTAFTSGSTITGIWLDPLTGYLVVVEGATIRYVNPRTGVSIASFSAGATYYIHSGAAATGLERYWPKTGFVFLTKGTGDPGQVYLLDITARTISLYAQDLSLTVAEFTTGIFDHNRRVWIGGIFEDGWTIHLLARAAPRLLDLDDVVTDTMSLAGFTAGDLSFEGFDPLQTWGFVIHNNTTTQNAMRTLADIYSFFWCDTGSGFYFKMPATGDLLVADAAFATTDIVERPQPVQSSDEADIRTPSEIELDYVSKEGAYKSRPVSFSMTTGVLASITAPKLSTPILLSDAEAQRICQEKFFDLQEKRRSHGLVVAPEFIEILPGDIVSFPSGTISYTARVEQVGVDLRSMGVELLARDYQTEVATEVTSTSNQPPLPGPMVPAGEVASVGGQSMTVSVGSVTVSVAGGGSVTVGIGGQAMTVSVGGVTVDTAGGDVTAGVSGQSMTASVGDVTVSIGSGGDPSFSSVVLLVGANGADGSTTFTDESSFARTLTTNGNAQIDTAQSKFGGSSMLLDGSGDYVSAADSNDWTFGTGPFTIEGFFRFTTISGSSTVGLVTQWGSGTTGWAFWFNGGNLQFRGVDTGGTTRDSAAPTGFTPTTGVWYHLAVDRDGSNLRLYVDGAMQSKIAYTHNLRNGDSPLDIGQVRGFGLEMAGWIDELRITKGVARYASDSGFTVPTAAFPRS